MDINELKQKILKKLDDEKQSPPEKKEDALKLFDRNTRITPSVTTLVLPDTAIDPSGYENLKKSLEVYQARLASFENENRKTKRLYDDLMRQNELLKSTLDEKARIASGLETRLAELAQSQAKNGAVIGDAENRASVIDAERQKLKKQYEEALAKNDMFLAQLGEAHKKVRALEQEVADARRAPKFTAGQPGVADGGRVAHLEAEIKSIKELHASVLAQNKELMAAIDEKRKTIDTLEKRLQTEAGDLRKEKERAVANSDALRSKLYAATKDLREQTAAAARLDEQLKAKDRRIAEGDAAVKRHETLSAERFARIEMLEREKKALTEKIDSAAAEIAARDTHVNEMSALMKTVDAAKSELTMQAETAHRAVKDLESKIAQLTAELAAKNGRVQELERLYKEIDEKTQVSVRATQALEREKQAHGDRLEQLSRDIAARDARLAEMNLAIKKSDAARNELLSKIEILNEEKKAFAEKSDASMRETMLRDAKISELNEALQALEAARGDLEVKSVGAGHIIADLEGKVAQLATELAAKNSRVRELERSYAEIGEEMKEMSRALQAGARANQELTDRIEHISFAQSTEAKKREAEMLLTSEEIARLTREITALKECAALNAKREADLNEEIARLVSEIEARDKKIDADLKYHERVVKEINDLRQKFKSSPVKPK